MKIVGESFAGVATAATKMVELYIPENQRLFEDPYLVKLLPWGWRLVFRLAFLPGLRQAVLALRERRMPGSLGSILCRTRYIDDVLKESLEAGLDQVVILGAGFDTRPYRIPGIEGVRVFEVDLPGTRALKLRRLAKVLGSVPPHVTLIGMDFDREDLAEKLAAAGFQQGLRNLFIWEGVTQYLTPDAVAGTLKFVARYSGPGSTIVFTYIPRGLIDGTDRPEWMDSLLKFAKMAGSPIIFGLDPDDLGKTLAEYGLALVSDVGAGDYQERYLKPLDRTLNVFEGERAAVAIRG